MEVKRAGARQKYFPPGVLLRLGVFSFLFARLADDRRSRERFILFFILPDFTLEKPATRPRDRCGKERGWTQDWFYQRLTDFSRNTSKVRAPGITQRGD